MPRQCGFQCIGTMCAAECTGDRCAYRCQGSHEDRRGSVDAGDELLDMDGTIVLTPVLNMCLTYSYWC